MCELFGMSARKPSAVNVYLDLLGSRGGGSGTHVDGWGDRLVRRARRRGLQAARGRVPLPLHFGALGGSLPGGIEAVLRDPVERLNALGELNFLLADGVHLLAYATAAAPPARASVPVGAVR